MRDGFLAIVRGWSFIDDVDALGDRIDQVGEWMKENGPLTPDEELTLQLMIRTQIAQGIKRGDFEPFLGPGDEEVLL
ncbi:MAG TPA: hypothetical protein VFB27_14800 [Opitutaceae bacterium]|nr:hypothetical protein [Opitutaceae bacterium]